VTNCLAGSAGGADGAWCLTLLSAWPAGASWLAGVLSGPGISNQYNERAATLLGARQVLGVGLQMFIGYASGSRKTQGCVCTKVFR
jgi:hypothetical protein